MNKILSFIVLMFVGIFSIAQNKPDAGLIIPKGFTAVKLVEGYGKVRHIAITKQGNIYVKLNK